MFYFSKDRGILIAEFVKREFWKKWDANISVRCQLMPISSVKFIIITHHIFTNNNARQNLLSYIPPPRCTFSLLLESRHSDGDLWRTLKGNFQQAQRHWQRCFQWLQTQVQMQRLWWTDTWNVVGRVRELQKDLEQRHGWLYHQIAGHRWGKSPVR